MRPQPNKPVMFEVIHEWDDVELAMGEYKEAIKGKKTLYIELFPSNVNAAINNKIIIGRPSASYELLVQIAHNNGLKVVALDSEKLEKKYQTLFRKMRAGKIKQIPPGVPHLNPMAREKRWTEILKNTKSDSLIVMHPGHAAQINEALQLPKENILRSERYPREHQIHSVYNTPMETKLKAEIERRRIARGLQKSKTRINQAKHKKP